MLLSWGTKDQETIMEYVLLGVAIFFEILASSLLHTSKGFTQFIIRQGVRLHIRFR